MTQEDRSAIAVLAARFCEKTPDNMSLADRLEQVISDKIDWIKVRDAAEDPFAKHHLIVDEISDKWNAEHGRKPCKD